MAFALALLPFQTDEDQPTDGHWRAGNLWHYTFLGSRDRDTCRARFIRNMIGGRLELAAAAILGVVVPPYTNIVDRYVLRNYGHFPKWAHKVVMRQRAAPLSESFCDSDMCRP